MCVTLFSVNISVLHRSPVCFSYILLGSVEQTEHHSQRKHPDIVSVLDAFRSPVGLYMYLVCGNVNRELNSKQTQHKKHYLLSLVCGNVNRELNSKQTQHKETLFTVSGVW